MKQINIELEHTAYPVVIEECIETHLLDFILKHRYQKVLIITDTTVNNLYGEDVRSAVQTIFPDVHLCVLPDSEHAKSLECLTQVLDVCMDYQLDRTSLLIGLGGGCISDVTGLCATLWMRGLDHIHIPTTLLAMVDASVGGKTAINYKGHKNILGTFKHPKAVFCDTHYLKTLPKRELSNGFAEIIKHSLLACPSLVQILLNADLQGLTVNSDLLQDIIFQNIGIKYQFIKHDIEDHGIRRMLNFGHTIGHAIEAVNDFVITHGEAVCLGMQTVLAWGLHKGYTSDNTLQSAQSLINQYCPHAPYNHLNLDILPGLVSDKKNSNSMLNIIGLKDIADPFVLSIAPQEFYQETKVLLECITQNKA